MTALATSTPTATACPRCHRVGLHDGDEMWCPRHGMYDTPVRATDLFTEMRGYRVPNPVWHDDDDLRLLLAIESGQTFEEAANHLGVLRRHVIDRFLVLLGGTKCVK